MIIPDCAPHTCNPLIAVILGAFLALTVFVGGLGAVLAADRLRAYRERRLHALHPQRREKP